MAYPEHPTVDISFLDEKIKAHANLAGSFVVGATHNYVKEGDKPMYKRLISIRNLGDEQAGLDQATGIALNLGFLGELMEWLEANRNWKEGGYIDDAGLQAV